MDPNGHSFCSSSVMTYSKVGDEPPKVFQAATQTRRAPGGVSAYYCCVLDEVLLDSLIWLQTAPLLLQSQSVKLLVGTIMPGIEEFFKYS